MSKKSLFIGAIASILALNAYATSSTVTSKDYVDARDALKQDLIDAEMMGLQYPKGTISLPTLVSYDNIDNLTGTKYGIMNANGGEWLAVEENNAQSTVLPTLNVVEYMVNERQWTIPASGKYSDVEGNVNNINPVNGASQQSRWIDDSIKGTGLVTKTDIDGVVGERKIFETSDVSGYHAQNLSNKEKELQDISIPTVGAMMNAISNGVNAATPTGNPNTIANFDSNGALGSGIATYTGAAAYNATNDSAKIPTMAGVTNYAQAKKVCVGWPDGTTVADATHTDANCWLWNLPD